MAKFQPKYNKIYVTPTQYLEIDLVTIYKRTSAIAYITFKSPSTNRPYTKQNITLKDFINDKTSVKYIKNIAYDYDCSPDTMLWYLQFYSVPTEESPVIYESHWIEKSNDTDLLKAKWRKQDLQFFLKYLIMPSI